MDSYNDFKPYGVKHNHRKIARRTLAQRYELFFFFFNRSLGRNTHSRERNVTNRNGAGVRLGIIDCLRRRTGSQPRDIFVLPRAALIYLQYIVERLYFCNAAATPAGRRIVNYNGDKTCIVKNYCTVIGTSPQQSSSTHQMPSFLLRPRDDDGHREARECTQHRRHTHARINARPMPITAE